MINLIKKITTFIFLFTFMLSFSQEVNKTQIKKLRKKGYSIRQFYNGYAIVYNKSKKFGLINTDGKFILKPKYNYLSNISKNGNLITGDYIYSGNDGGGRGKIGLKNIKIISKQGKIIKEGEYVGKRIEFLKSPYHYGLYSYFKLWDTNRKGTLINCDGKALIKPVYEYISFFNKEGHIIAFVNDEIHIFNNKGEKLNSTPLKYKIELHPSVTSRFPLLKDYNTQNLQVFGKKIICSIDGVKYGIFDLIKNKGITPFKYTKIDTKLFIKEKDTIAYKVFKNNLSTFVDYHTNLEIAPFIFEEVTDIFNFKKQKIIEGNKKTTKSSIKTIWTNYYNLETKKLIFPKELKLYKAKPINSKFWIVTVDYHSIGVYNLQNLKFIEKPVLNKYLSIDILSANLVLFNTVHNGAWIFDLDKKEKVEIFNQKPSIYKFKLKKGNTKKNFIVITNGRKKTLYDEKFNIIFENLSYNASYVEEDRFIIKERINNKYVKTAYGIDGNIIGEQYNYKK